MNSQIKCPYCNVKLLITLKSNGGCQIVWCDPDENGCDNSFAIEVQFEPKIKIYVEVAQK